jgi:hypothetical protein
MHLIYTVSTLNSLPFNLTDVSSRINYALHLLNLGQTAQATNVVNALANTSQEDTDFLLVFNILKSLQLDSLGLDGMNPTQQADMYSISDHRNQASYIAQSILEQYYGYSFPLMIDDYNTIPIQNVAENRTKRESTVLSKLFVSPNPVSNELLIEFSSKNESNGENLELEIHRLDGKKYYSGKVMSKMNHVNLKILEWTDGIYQVSLIRDGKICATTRFVKN